MSIDHRLRRLERNGRVCPACYHEPERCYAYYPGEGEERPEPPTCPRCARPLGVVIAVLYEGGGGISYEPL